MVKDMRLTLAIISISMLLATAANSEQSGNYQKQIALSGHQLKLLSIAAQEAETKGLKIPDYDVSLYQHGTNFLVAFLKPGQSIGEGGKRGGGWFGVELNNRYVVLSSHFMR